MQILRSDSPKTDWSSPLTAICAVPNSASELRGRLRSTTQAIHVARRRIESADRHGSTLHVKLLDWTVFHKLHPQAVPQALARHGVSPEFITLVEAIYRCPIHSPGRRTNQLATFTGQFGDSAGLPAFPLLVPGGARHDHGRRRRGNSIYFLTGELLNRLLRPNTWEFG